jgi:hypothetical protein
MRRLVVGQKVELSQQPGALRIYREPAAGGVVWWLAQGRGGRAGGLQ